MYSEATDGSVKIRASATTALMECELRAAVSILSRIFADHGFELPPTTLGVGALVGSGVHEGAKFGLTEMKDSGTLAPLSAMADAAVGEFQTRSRDEGAPGIAWDRESPSPKVAEQQIVRMTAQYRIDVVAKSRPLLVEDRLEAEFEPGIILSGQSDLLSLDSTEPMVTRLHDLKTGRVRSHPQKHMAQLGSYGLLMRAHGHEPDETAVVDFLRRAGVKAMQPEVEEQPFSLVDAEAIAHNLLTGFAAKVRKFQARGDPGVFLVNPASHLCSPAYCRAYGSTACVATRAAKRN